MHFSNLRCCDNSPFVLLLVITMPNFRQICYYLIPNKHVLSDHVLVKFEIEKNDCYIVIIQVGICRLFCSFLFLLTRHG